MLSYNKVSDPYYQFVDAQTPSNWPSQHMVSLELAVIISVVLMRQNVTDLVLNCRVSTLRMGTVNARHLWQRLACSSGKVDVLGRGFSNKWPFSWRGFAICSNGRERPTQLCPTWSLFWHSHRNIGYVQCYVRGIFPLAGDFKWQFFPVACASVCLCIYRCVCGLSQWPHIVS